jgi:hypothetical protein
VGGVTDWRVVNGFFALTTGGWRFHLFLRLSQ